ncbi:MAG: 4Fe-4S dicluster domain-containing protein [Candidatus Omnitrophica bacterium]|nr:4Fe-4S dicluster domain-containing protein [Candidatus Omnitrophota bacterium]MDD5574261.1 4Fe-4S dicluster domain-containing protein [Candidatus Omnitrophota bacterium]
MKKTRVGKMAACVLRHVFKKPATTRYPFVKSSSPKAFRGKIVFYPEKCVGCKMCMRDCPSGAIEIAQTGEKQFEATFDLSKCIYCAQCVDSCLKKALEFSGEFELARLDRRQCIVTFRAPHQKTP